MNKIEQFIKDNKLDLVTEGSRNSNYVILSGYALYLGYSIEGLWSDLEDTIIDDDNELERVFKYAEENSYGEWWISKEAKEQYIF